MAKSKKKQQNTVQQEQNTGTEQLVPSTENSLHNKSYVLR